MNPVDFFGHHTVKNLNKFKSHRKNALTHAYRAIINSTTNSTPFVAETNLLNFVDSIHNQ